MPGMPTSVVVTSWPRIRPATTGGAPASETADGLPPPPTLPDAPSPAPVASSAAPPASLPASPAGSPGAVAGSPLTSPQAPASSSTPTRQDRKCMSVLPGTGYAGRQEGPTPNAALPHCSGGRRKARGLLPGEAAQEFFDV